LHPDILEIVRLCGTEYDFFTKMNTNGMALTRELSEGLIRNRLDYLVFSLDAVTRETFKRIKRRDLFRQVMNNILDYLEVWGDIDMGQNHNYFACDINLLEEDANRHEIPVFKEHFKKLPVGHLSVYQLHNFTGPVEEVNSQMDGAPRRQNDKWPCCNTPWDLMGIRWNGDVGACLYDYDSRYIVGNVKEKSIWEIWNDKPMREFRQALLDRDLACLDANGPMCSTCSIKWQEEYHLPGDFHNEIKRMERYLVAAIDRVARRYERTDILLEKHRYLKNNRKQWLQELYDMEQGLVADQAEGA
jgi:radical SAM protein with 4Fe4S-binding SPASM domain